MSSTTSTRKPRSSKLGAKLARKPRKVDATKPEAETIPLAGVSITIAKPKLFTNDEEAVTFDGARLSAVLRWAALVKPNLDAFTSPISVGLELAGIAEQCRAMGDANLEMIPIDCNAVFCSLGNRLRDLAHRINAGEKVGKLESVTITRKPAAGPSSSAEPDAARKIAAYDAAQRIVDAVKRKAVVA